VRLPQLLPLVPPTERIHVHVRCSDIRTKTLGHEPEHCGIGHHERIAQHLAEWAGTTLPVDERARLLGDDSNGENDIGNRGDAGVMVLEGQHEAGALECLTSECGIREVTEINTAGDDRANRARLRGQQELLAGQTRLSRK
jgi:hypothetical protein